MERRKILTLALMLLFSVATVVAKELRTVVFKVEQMECQNCVKKIKNNIKFEKGLKKIETNLDKKTVTITYDADKTDVEKIKAGFKKINYDVVVLEDGAEKKEKK